MKSFIKKWVIRYLAFLARHRISREKAKIIGITGSYGKTSTKEAIAFLLSKKYRVYASQKSLNTEMGFPLALLELPSGYSNPFAWLHILIRAPLRALTRFNHDYLVLEYGADKPGDIDYLLSIAKPTIAVLTGVAPTHLDRNQFESVEAIFEEKKKLLLAVGKEGLTVFDADNHLFQGLSTKLTCEIKRFGEHPTADLRVTSIAADLNGISGTLATTYNLKPETYHFKVLGKQHISIFLAALLVGEKCGIPISEGVKILEDFRLPPGRMSKLQGKNNSILLDSTYNASPKTMEAALRFFHELPAKRKIAILGSMNELGIQSERFHRSIGRLARQTCDILITVGKDAAWISKEALKEGMPESCVKTFSTADEAGSLMENFVQEGDLILLKGSQNRVRLERVTKKLLREPSQAKESLVRQEKEWNRL